MKKIFALALAAVMAAGMTTTAFALDQDRVIMIGAAGSTVYVDDNDNGKFGDADDIEKTLPAIDPAKDTLTSVDVSVIKGGKKVAIPLFFPNGDPITDKDDIKSYKVKSDWSVGGLDDKATIELVKIDDQYRYAVTFVMPEAAETKDSDLAGQISVYKNSSDLKDSNADKKYYSINFGSTYGYKVEALGDIDNDIASAEIVEFKDTKGGNKLEGEETLVTGDFEFEVDVTGQGKLNLKNNVDFNKEFAAMYDYANIDFITFEKEPTFNKNGVVYLYADEDAFVYEVTADGAKEIKGLTWDEDYEAWSWKTRTLKSYAISDVELTEKTVTEDKDDTTTDDGKVNPDTGR